jgi:hypothetical protein
MHQHAQASSNEVACPSTHDSERLSDTFHNSLSVVVVVRYMLRHVAVVHKLLPNILTLLSQILYCLLTLVDSPLLMCILSCFTSFCNTAGCVTQLAHDLQQHKATFPQSVDNA